MAAVSTDSDDDGALLQAEIDDDDHWASVIFVSHVFQQWQNAGMAVALYTTLDDDSGCDLDDGGDYSVNADVPRRDHLEALLASHASIFRHQTNFTPAEWEKLCNRVVPLIRMRARSTGEIRGVGGRPPKLTDAQRLLSCILFLKKAKPRARDEAVRWNWSRSSACDDCIFVCTLINEALADELQWPDAARRAELAEREPFFYGCIGFIDGTLVRINRPAMRNSLSSRYYTKRKKLYAFNNTIVVDHDGFIIYIDAGWAGSFHDVRILQESHLHKNWRDYFTRLDEYIEFLLGDRKDLYSRQLLLTQPFTTAGYLGVEMYIMRRVDAREFVNIQGDVLNAYNKRHAGKRVKVEWGIGGVKMKWGILHNTFNLRRHKFAVIFEACCKLVNFIHRHRRDYGIVADDNARGGAWGDDESDEE